MALPSGKLASFSFAGTVYNSDDCLQGWTLNDSINEVIYQCSGLDKAAAGTRSVTFNASLALAASDTTKVSNLSPGSTGVFEAHPAGDTSGYQEIEATSAMVITANRSTAPNSIISLDVTIRLQDITIQAAT